MTPIEPSKEMLIASTINNLNNLTRDYQIYIRSKNKEFDHLKMACICGAIQIINEFDNTKKEPLTILAKMLLVITELDEAMEYYYNGVGDPLGEELADAAIRMFTIMHDITDNKWNFRYTKTKNKSTLEKRNTPLEKQLWKVIHNIVLATEYWRDDNWIDIQISLELAISKLFLVADNFGIDIWLEMLSKCNKNIERKPKHNRKQSAG